MTKYHSPVREARAARTRRRVLDAAQSLFVRDGYAATPVTAIAEQAGVSPETIYKTFGSKAAVLQGSVVRSVTGEDTDSADALAAPLAWVQDVLAIDDPQARIEAVARVGRRIYEQTAAIQQVVTEAAATEPDIAQQLQANQDRRLADLRLVVQSLADDGVLRTTVQEATDVIWTVASPHVYDQLTRNRSWTPQRYESWLSGFLTRELLA